MPKPSVDGVCFSAVVASLGANRESRQTPARTLAMSLKRDSCFVSLNRRFGISQNGLFPYPRLEFRHHIIHTIHLVILETLASLLYISFLFPALSSPNNIYSSTHTFHSPTIPSPPSSIDRYLPLLTKLHPN